MCKIGKKKEHDIVLTKKWFYLNICVINEADASLINKYLHTVRRKNSWRFRSCKFGKLQSEKADFSSFSGTYLCLITCTDKYFILTHVNEWRGFFQHQMKGEAIFTALQIFLFCPLQQSNFTCNTTRNKEKKKNIGPQGGKFSWLIHKPLADVLFLNRL